MRFTPSRPLWAATRALLLVAVGYALLLRAGIWLVADPIAALRAPGPASYDDSVTTAAGAAAVVTLSS